MSSRGLAIGVFLALGTAACATVPDRDALEATTAVLPGPAGHGPGTDGRAGFRRVFCEIARGDGVVPADDPECEGFLWRLADEPAPPGGGLPGRPAGPLRWFIVTGALGDCFGEDSLPFREAVARLSREGASVETLLVSGRSGTEHNAAQIEAALAAAELGPEDRVALVGYSKGAVDILQFLVDYPESAGRVAAVVSVSGPITGSPLAETGEWTYEHLLAHAFAGRCDPGDGRLVESLLPETRTRWLAEHPLPGHVAYFSLAAFTTREHLATGLRGTWQLLADSDPRNDGQVPVSDAMIPGSTLLGYANSDHWGVALTVENALPHVAGRDDPRPYPQTQLLMAIRRFVESATGDQ